MVNQHLARRPRPSLTTTPTPTPTPTLRGSRGRQGRSCGSAVFFVGDFLPNKPNTPVERSASTNHTLLSCWQEFMYKAVLCIWLLPALSIRLYIPGARRRPSPPLYAHAKPASERQREGDTPSLQSETPGTPKPATIKPTRQLPHRSTHLSATSVHPARAA